MVIKVRQIFRRFWPDSLFTRMLVTQGALFVTALLLSLLLTISQRYIALTPSWVARSVPVIRHLASLPIGTTLAGELSSDLRSEPGLPSGFHMWVKFLPTHGLAKVEFAKHGIILDEVWLAPRAGQMLIFQSMRIGGGPTIWISTSISNQLPAWNWLIVAGCAIQIAFMAIVSRYFVRRVTRPLATLHSRMLSHAKSGTSLAPPSPRRHKPSPEIQAMNDAYTQLAERLERNERERALLLAGVSHDLRSPLARIRLAAELLPETPDNADGVATVTRNVDVADRLIASFLEFIRAGTQTLGETVDAAEAVRSAVAGFGLPTSELAMHLPERLLLHGASHLLVERLVVNLVDNALKHGSKPIQVHLACEGERMRLAVVDMGPGLPHGTGDSLVEAFARGDASRNVPGFGLGLAIVRQIVTRLQGQLHFDQSSPVGLSVQVEMPLQR